MTAVTEHLLNLPGHLNMPKWIYFGYRLLDIAMGGKTTLPPFNKAPDSPTATAALPVVRPGHPIFTPLCPSKIKIKCPNVKAPLRVGSTI